MSNDEYMKLYEQYQNMIIMLARKYAKLNLIEYEDLLQVAMITLVKCYNNYDANKGMSFSTYLYSNIEFAIKNELRKVKHQDRDCISLQTSLFDAEGKEITLEDTLIDDRVDIEAQVYDGMVKDIYKKEIEKYIDGKKLDICLLRWFNNCSYNYISTVTGVNNISNTLMECRMRLITRSPLYKNEYMKLIGISEYRTERAAII